MKPLGMIVALIALLGVLLAPAVAQKPQGSPDPGPEEERMARMLGMMEQMEGQMKQMHEQMKDMQGMEPMRGRMGRMTGMMGRMTSMMEEHRGEMHRYCPGRKP
jgi:hypothetical protein